MSLYYRQSAPNPLPFTDSPASHPSLPLLVVFPLLTASLRLRGNPLLAPSPLVLALQWCYSVIGGSIDPLLSHFSPLFVCSPSSSLADNAPPLVVPPGARRGSLYPHLLVVLVYRWRLHRPSLFHSPLRLVAVAPSVIYRRQTPSPLPPGSLLTYSTTAGSLLLSRLPPAALLPCPLSPGSLLPSLLGS